MQGRVFGIMTLGFASFLLIGAAGAASDSYFENAAEIGAYQIACETDRMELDRPDLDRPNCSVHRVSPTYGRQLMAMNLTHNDEIED